MALLDETSDARTERPTERHRRQARERGLVARSVELLIAARLLAIWIVLAWWFAKFATSASESLRFTLEHAGSNTLQPSTALIQFRDLAWHVLASASWPLLSATAAILLAHFAQVGWLWRWENATPQLARLSPITGLQRLSSWATIGRAFGLTLKLVIVVATTSFVLPSLLPLSPSSLNSDFTIPLTSFGSNAVQLVAHVALALLALAALDYVWQRWRFERSLQMTREELREELKEIEVDPHLKNYREATAHQRTFAVMPSQSNTNSTS